MIKLRIILKIAVVLILSLLILVFFGQVIFNATYKFPQKVEYGVTFSPRYATYMKLDWEKIYINMLDDLKVRNLRIPSYWDILQKDPAKIDFSQTDYMLNEAGKRKARVIMVIGVRQPRWPECHIPVWAKQLTVVKRQDKLLQFMDKVLERYKDHPAVWAWQVENESFLWFFGEGCDSPDQNFLKAEADLARKISPKTIIMTDSGELGFWAASMKLSDIFGTTLYRQVYSGFLGYTTYPVTPSFYRLKSDLIKKFFAPNNQKTIIVELQAEPWLAGGIFKSPEQQSKLFNVTDFINYISFAQKTGFNEAYLWGVEWWYFMAQNGYPEYLEYAKTLFR